MKKITSKTILKQGDKTFQPVEVDGVVYWDDEEATECRYYLHHSVDSRHQIYDLENGGSLSDFKKGQSIKWCSKIVAQSQPKLEGVPVISLDSYFKQLFEQKTKTVSFGEHGIQSSFNWFNKGYQANPNEYTQKDIDKAIQLARPQPINGMKQYLTKEQILEQINSISVIEVDEQFNILSYE